MFLSLSAYRRVGDISFIVSFVVCLSAIFCNGYVGCCDNQEDYRIRFRRSTHVTPDLIQRLGLQAELDVCL